MEKLTSNVSAYTDKQQKSPKFSAREIGVFENGEFSDRRSFLDFIKRLVRGLLSKFKPSPSRSGAA